jgi:hypothetical protein
MPSPQLFAVTPVQPQGADTSELWSSLRDAGGGEKPSAPASGAVMESGLSVLKELSEAPPRTLHNASLVKSSPLSSTVRAMLESRAFGRRFDAIPMDVASVEDRLPTLNSPEGDVLFLASDRSLEDLSLSVDGLLQHRKRLLASSVNPDLKRRHVFIVGAGPAGLVAAIQLSLRDHHVVVCEQREVYSRNRYIGVYKEVTHLMAALGMPERMTYDFSQYRGKSGIMLADIQTLLHGVALKLGVVIYAGATAHELNLATLRSGEVELQRATQAAAHSAEAVGITRWHYDSVARVASGVTVRFDTVLEASGGRSGMRETLVGSDNIASLHEIGMAAAEQDSSLASFFNDPEDHCAEYVDSDYGCSTELLPIFANKLMSGDKTEIPDEIPCFVSNIDASIFAKQMQQANDSDLGLASRVGDRELIIPHDWVVLECRLADRSLSRYHIEGPLPQNFAFGEDHVSTKASLDKLNPVSFLLRTLYAMGLPFDAIDRRQLIDFYMTEASHGDARDIVSTWVGRFQGLRVCASDKPIWYGKVPGSDTVEYGIIGEAMQNAWYRFGVGVDDSFTGAAFFCRCMDLESNERTALAMRMERVMQSRAVQILYHLYAVAQDKEQGVIGSVLTEYHMEERHSEGLAETRLKGVARQAAEILSAEQDLRASGTEPLLEESLDYLRASSCRRALSVLESFVYPAPELAQAQQIATSAHPQWRERTRAVLMDILTPEHQEQMIPLLSEVSQEAGTDGRLWEERLLELASARYRWVSPWLRACALKALNPATANANAVLVNGAKDSNPLVAEIALETLRVAAEGGNDAKDHTSTLGKVLLLKKVSMFEGIPYEILVGVASLLHERTVQPGDRIIQKGDLGDTLYIIASGLVRIHDGDRTFSEMSDHEFFGELALLDSEPRSASVSALKTTLLFCITQSDFYAIMREQPEIVRAINRALCKLIRNA